MILRSLWITSSVAVRTTSAPLAAWLPHCHRQLQTITLASFASPYTFTTMSVQPLITFKAGKCDITVWITYNHSNKQS